MKLLVASIDAMFSSDVDILKSQEPWQRYDPHTVVQRDVEPVYPALTYPCHASLLSGNLPLHHGVYQNTVFDFSKRSPDWWWDYGLIQGGTIFEDMRSAGLRVASVFWPVTANAPVDYLIGEIWSKVVPSIDVMEQTSSHNINHIIERYRDRLDFDDKYRQDDYAVRCAMDIIDEFDPDVFFIHFCVVDQMRHRYGLHHPKVTEALTACAQWVDRIAEAATRRNGGRIPGVMLLGDHGHLPVGQMLHFNTVFQQRGWFDPEHPDDYAVYCHEAGVSAQIYVRAAALRLPLEALFAGMIDEGRLLYMFDKAAMREQGVDGPFDYVLEAADGYAISGSVTPEEITPVYSKCGASEIGQHGHHPSRGDKPPIVLYHPQIAQRQTGFGGSVTDLAPTLLQMLDIPSSRKMDGKALPTMVRAYRSVT